MGSVLAGARFGFTTGWRRLIEQRDASGVLAQVFLLALAAAVSMPLLAAFPTDLGAALGPPSISLLVGAFVFGARSEEHTSELQSLMRISYAVFCLKKKTH